MKQMVYNILAVSFLAVVAVMAISVVISVWRENFWNGLILAVGLIGFVASCTGQLEKQKTKGEIEMFKSTNQALAFGLKASPKQIKPWSEIMLGIKDYSLAKWKMVRKRQMLLLIDYSS